MWQLLGSIVFAVALVWFLNGLEDSAERIDDFIAEHRRR